MIHGSLDLTNLSATTTAGRFLEQKNGSLVSTYQIKKLVLTVSAGTSVIHIDNPPNYHDVSGFVYSGGVRYDANSYAHISLTWGRALESTVFQNHASFADYVRFEANFNLF